MDYIRLGKTNLLISRLAFGAMRLSEKNDNEDCAVLVRKAYEAGINLYDTSSKYPLSEKLLGDALYDIRNNVILSTTTAAKSKKELLQDIENSLMTLHTDSLDLYQYEAESFVPLLDGDDEVYSTLVELKKSGKIKHIGIVTTDFDNAKLAVESDLYETLQYPFSVVSDESCLELIKLCEEHDVGFIAMQPLGGGILENVPLAYGFLSQYESVVPIWGVKSQEELNQILYFNEHPPVIDDDFKKDVENIRSFFN